MTTNEKYLAAICMAQPEMVAALQLRPNKFTNPTAAAVIEVIYKQGKAFALPAPMFAALKELPQELDGADVEEIFELIPTDQLTFEDVQAINVQVVANTAEVKFKAKQARLEQDFKAGRISSKTYIEELNKAYDDVRSGVEVDRTTSAALEQLMQDTRHYRFALSKSPDDTWGFLDWGFHGYTKDGEPIEGLYGVGEVSFISAGYKAGKTTLALEFARCLLHQGAKVGYAILEDNKETLHLKLMANEAHVERHFVHSFLLGKFDQEYIGSDREEVKERIQKAVDWFRSLGDQLIVIDSEDPSWNIHDWGELKDAITVLKYTHNLEVFFVDYLQELSEEYDELKKIVIEVRAVASRNRIHVCVLSQMSNDAYATGGTAGRLAVRGTGNAGAAAHWGLELWQDHETGEVAIKMAIVRNSRPRTVYVVWNWESGAVKHYGIEPLYAETQRPEPKKRGRRGSK
jgi:archaellum biogenesis ATPase FlaH